MKYPTRSLLRGTGGGLLSGILALVVLASVLGSTPADSPPAAETRIVFKRGAIEAQFSGSLTSITDALRFVLRARSGQRMRLAADADGPTRGLVTFPSGDTDGGPGPVFFDAILPSDGDYRISITESRMGEEWKGKLTLHVLVK